MAKIDISKVDCCDACFEEHIVEGKSQDKINPSFISMTINHKTIKFCKHHAKMLKDELISYDELTI